MLHKIKEVYGAISHKMDELILRKHQVDGTQLLIYIYINYVCHTFQNKMISFLGSLLQCIGQFFFVQILLK